MKKPLAILSIILAMLAAVGMAFPVAADDPTPTTTPEPPVMMHVVVGYGSGLSAVQYGEIQCMTVEGVLHVLTGDGYNEWEIMSFDTAGFTCIGEVEWTPVNEWPTWRDHYKGDICIDVTFTGTIYYDADFSGNGINSENNTPCSFPPNTITSGVGETSSGVLKHGGSGEMWDDPLIQYIYVHDEGKPPCANAWETTDVVVNDGIIDATDEDGVPETLDINSYYRLTVFGGPWNDSLADRRDTAVKIDGGPWQPLDEYFDLTAACSETDPADATKLIILFQAVQVDFAIRVNDLETFFADNTGGMEFTLEKVQPANDGCQGQYLEGSLIVSGTIPANSSTGVHPDFSVRQQIPYPGQWIEIVTSGGPWLNDGTGANRYDIALKNPDASWSPLSGSTYAACTVTDGDYITAYVQITSKDGIWLRVNDTSTWVANSGSMGYAIYNVTYTPRDPIGCAEYYHLGNLIKSVDAPGNLKTGVSVGSLYIGTDVTGGEEEDTTSYLAIETDGFFYNGPNPEVLGAITASTTQPVTGDFENLQTYSEVTCYAPLDPVGHIRVYIPIGPNIDNYWVRAQDMIAGWSDNSGHLTFKFYTAQLLRPPGYIPGTMPGAGICDPLYTKGAAGPTYTLYGNYSSFVSLPALTAKKIYALEISAGPWLNDSVGSYEVEINDGASSYNYNLLEFPGAACAQSADGLHLLLYFQALAGRHYKIRVYDPGIDFTDNADSIDVILYNNVTNKFIPENPCSEDYNLTKIGVYDNKIPTSWQGVSIPAIGIGSGNTYAIEINDGDYWHFIATPTEHHYDAQIASTEHPAWDDFDGGWVSAICAIQLNTGASYEKRYRIYFVAPDSGQVNMRTKQSNVADSLITSGYLTYTLYGATLKPPDNPPTDPIIPPGWQAECYEKYLRPSGLVKWSTASIPDTTIGSINLVNFPPITVPIVALDDWISYLQWTIRSYFAWCPQHTAALAGLPLSMDDYEPFGTMIEVNDTFLDWEQIFDDLVATGGEGAQFAPHSVVFNSGGGGEGSETGWGGIFTNPGTDSPWAWTGGPSTVHTGEDIVFDATPPSGGETDYITFCTGIMDAHFATALGTGMCAMLDLVRGMPKTWMFFQFIIDVGAVFGLFNYILRAWVDRKMSA